jgi:hypothetical protein
VNDQAPKLDYATPTRPASRKTGSLVAGIIGLLVYVPIFLALLLAIIGSILDLTDDYQRLGSYGLLVFELGLATFTVMGIVHSCRSIWRRRRGANY